MYNAVMSDRSILLKSFGSSTKMEGTSCLKTGNVAGRSMTVGGSLGIDEGSKGATWCHHYGLVGVH